MRGNMNKFIKLSLVTGLLVVSSVKAAEEEADVLHLCLDEANKAHESCISNAWDILSEGVDADTFMIYQSAYNDYNYYCAHRRDEDIKSCYSDND